MCGNFVRIYCQEGTWIFTIMFLLCIIPTTKYLYAFVTLKWAFYIYRELVLFYKSATLHHHVSTVKSNTGSRKTPSFSSHRIYSYVLGETRGIQLVAICILTAKMPLDLTQTLRGCVAWKTCNTTRRVKYEIKTKCYTTPLIIYKHRNGDVDANSFSI